MKYIIFLYGLMLGCLVANPAMAADEARTITVYRSPDCGCCHRWITHLQANGFTVTDIERDSLPTLKQELGVPRVLGSCHTATVDGYVIEGHVPASDIRRLLSRQPDIQGLSVPGMPIGSPGMEMGDRQEPYNVLQFDKHGRYSPYSQYPQ